tara:strand:- start:37263 stop:37511 length:249 start_codon:yes stop_codon:yes gene_type:complete
MKKIKLENLKIQTNDLLQRNELKTIFGGYGNELTYTCYRKNNNGVIVASFQTDNWDLAFSWMNAWNSLGYDTFYQSMPIYTP